MTAVPEVLVIFKVEVAAVNVPEAFIEKTVPVPVKLTVELLVVKVPALPVSSASAVRA